MSKVKHLTFIALQAFLCAALMSCAVSAQYGMALDSFSLPTGAHDVRRVDNPTSRTKQLFFKVIERYPSAESTKALEVQLDISEWSSCAPKVAGSEWSIFEDFSDKAILLVHQRVKYWINFGERAILQVATIYYSKELNSDVPDNEEQRVSIFVQQVDDINSEISKLKLSCGDI